MQGLCLIIFKITIVFLVTDSELGRFLLLRGEWLRVQSGQAAFIDLISSHSCFPHALWNLARWTSMTVLLGGFGLSGHGFDLRVGHLQQLSCTITVDWGQMGEATCIFEVGVALELHWRDHELVSDIVLLHVVHGARKDRSMLRHNVRFSYFFPCGRS